jgi:hypothetical protein
MDGCHVHRMKLACRHPPPVYRGMGDAMSLLALGDLDHRKAWAGRVSLRRFVHAAAGQHPYCG